MPSPLGLPRSFPLALRFVLSFGRSSDVISPPSADRGNVPPLSTWCGRNNDFDSENGEPVRGWT
jgi:hypothetical protein